MRLIFELSTFCVGYTLWAYLELYRCTSEVVGHVSRNLYPVHWTLKIAIVCSSETSTSMYITPYENRKTAIWNKAKLHFLFKCLCRPILGHFTNFCQRKPSVASRNSNQMSPECKIWSATVAPTASRWQLFFIVSVECCYIRVEGRLNGFVLQTRFSNDDSPPCTEPEDHT